MAAAIASITAEETKEVVDVLADDTFEGREAGSRGGRAAGNYLLREMESHGLEPAGESGTFYQAFNGSQRNILGLVRGSDPRLAEQVILVGAHYDHVGYGRATNSFGPWGYIHNGADDNASGVAALLELMEAVKTLPQAPRRSILFAFWDGEEAGLLGSRHWVSRPTIDFSRLTAAINIDMIGRMKDGHLEVLGSRSAAGWRRMVSEANSDLDAKIKFDWQLKPDSDHWPFYERRIPILMFHTGLHGDYHRPSDDAHKINSAGIAATSKIALRTILQWTDADRVPGFRDAGRRESPQIGAALEQPVAPQPPRFGMPFRVESGTPPRIILTGILPGSPAVKSGLQAGDELIELNGKPIASEQQLRLELLAASGETAFLVRREGSELPLLFKVTPIGEPVRVGITWRADDGEPGTVIVTQVIFGSAAHAAGVRVRDRLYAVGGQTFASEQELTRLLTNAGSPLDLRVERDGQVRDVSLELAASTATAP